MYKFSLVIPTIGRFGELEKLLNSILESSYQNYEVIIVDQNKNGLIDDLCYLYSKKLYLQHLKVNFIGAAKARNYGAKFTTGSIINFPDDDCEFTEDLLEKVLTIFEENKILDIVFGRTIDKSSNKNSVLNFPGQSKTVSKYNLYSTTVECTMFIKKEVFEEIGCYDESLGVGTFYGAEEGADLVLRGLYLGKRLIYDPSIIFYHPQKVKEYNSKDIQRAFNYGKGFGRLSVKHLFKFKKIYPFCKFLVSQTKVIFLIMLNFFTFKINKRKYYFNLLKGRNIGLFYSLKDFCR